MAAKNIKNDMFLHCDFKSKTVKVSFCASFGPTIMVPTEPTITRKTPRKSCIGKASFKYFVAKIVFPTNVVADKGSTTDCGA
eukprot:UN02865